MNPLQSATYPQLVAEIQARFPASLIVIAFHPEGMPSVPLQPRLDGSGDLLIKMGLARYADLALSKLAERSMVDLGNQMRPLNPENMPPDL